MALDGDSRAPGSVRWARLDWCFFFLCICSFASLPITAKYWPGQDNPNHLALAHILGHYADPDAPFQRYFIAHSLVKPYGLYYGLLLGLGRFVSLMTADKILVVAVIVGLPSSILVLLREIAPERARNTFLVIPFVTSWGMMAGFMAFHLAMIFAFLFVATVWTRHEVGRWRLAVGAATLLLCAALHPIVALLGGFSWVVLDADRIASPRAWLKWISIGSPAGLFLLVTWHLGQTATTHAFATAALDPNPAILYSRIDLVLLRFPSRALAALSLFELPLRVVPFGLLAAGGVLSVIRSRELTSRERSLGRWWLALVILYVGLPAVLYGWNLCSLHESVFLLFASAAVGWTPPRMAQKWIGGIAVLLVFGLTAIQRNAIARLERRVSSIVDVGSNAEKGSTLLPLFFETRGGSFNARPLLHSWGYLVINRDVVTPGIFAAGRTSMGGEPFRVLSFRQPFAPDFLPTLDEVPDVGATSCDGNFLCELERNHRSCSTLAIAKAYDYVLVEAAPPAFLSLLLKSFEVVARQDDVVLLHSPPSRPRRFDPAECTLPL